MKHVRARSRPAEQEPLQAAEPLVIDASGASPAGGRDEDLIRQTAYALYEARHRESGHELDDWLLAESRVRQAQCH